MTLQFQHNWERALVAATIAEAAKACPECKIGRTAIQKLVYFMHVLGVPMRYNFEIHHFGPFCSDITSDLDWLMADEIVVNDSLSDDKYNYRTTTSGYDRLAKTFPTEFEQHGKIISAVTKAFGDLSPSILELIATLDYSFRWVRACGGTGPWKQWTVDKFKSIKKEKFSTEQIDRWYNVLVELALIEK